MKFEKVRWGIIGCGDVTEVKSGPAFQKVKNSELVAVMRRTGELAKEYAERHHVRNGMMMQMLLLTIQMLMLSILRHHRVHIKNILLKWQRQVNLFM